MSTVHLTLQILLKDILKSPTEVKAFEILVWLEEHKHQLPRGGLENIAVTTLHPEHKGKQIQQACMALRDAMANNGQYEHACRVLSIIEVALHKQADKRKAMQNKARGLR